MAYLQRRASTASAFTPSMSAAPIIVIGLQYCAPCSVELAMRKAISFTDNYTVTGVNGNLIFKVEMSFSSLRRRRALIDAAGNPIVTICRKIMTMHDRLQVFRGESTEDHDLIFSVKRTSAVQLMTELDVFLANNTTEDVCDFKVKGCNWFERSCVVYAGESNVTLAQMQKKQTSELLGKTHFNVKVSPNVDYAFIVALIVIYDEINDSAEKTADVLRLILKE